MKFVSLQSFCGCLAVSQILLGITRILLLFRLQLSQIFYFLIIEQFSENSDLYSIKCLFLSPKCSKIVGGWGSAPDPAGKLTAFPQTS